MSGNDDTFERARAAFVAGVQHHEAGRLPEAEACYARAQALMPGRPSVLINLATVRLALGNPAPVPADLAPVLAADPANPEALALLARALTALDRPAQALPLVEQPQRQRPQDAELHHRRGLLLGRLGRADEALAAFDAALALDAAHAGAWTQRGSVLREAGRLADAAHCFRQALRHGGDTALNGWFLASVTGHAVECAAAVGCDGADFAGDTAGATAGDTAAAASAPTAWGQAPARYVQALFDGYAEGFDRHLVEGLGYGVPEALAALLPPGRHFASALDLGCGTGLCTPPLQGRVGRLVGVDLSPRMLEQARARGLYAELHEAELVAWLQGAEPGFDLVLAADVFIYIGDLAPVFAGVRRVLAPGGQFVFSVEAADDEAAVQLGAQLRYRHGEAALRALADAHGFEVHTVRREVLRHELQKPIDGLLMRLSSR
jgi:predicted TPR repeat methyltransferase